MDKTLFSIIGFTFAFILILFSIIGPWYSTSLEFNYTPPKYEIFTNLSKNQETDIQASIQYYLTKADSKGNFLGYYEETSIDYSDLKNQLSFYKSQSDLKTMDSVFFIFDLSFYLCILLFILILSALFCSIFLFFKIGDKIFIRNIAALLGFSAFILAIILILFFMVSWINILQDLPNLYGMSSIQGESRNPFFWYSLGSSSSSSLGTTEYNVSVGPGYSWYFILISGIISLITCIFIFRKIKPEKKELISHQYYPAYPPNNI